LYVNIHVATHKSAAARLTSRSSSNASTLFAPALPAFAILEGYDQGAANPNLLFPALHSAVYKNHSFIRNAKARLRGQLPALPRR